jgi:hypothetical protein
MTIPGDGALLRFELSVESMRLNILQALSARELDLQALVNSELECMKNDLPAIVRNAVRDGTKAVIERAVSAAIFDLQRQIQPAVRKAVSDVLAQAFPEEGAL